MQGVRFRLQATEDRLTTHEYMFVPVRRELLTMRRFVLIALFLALLTPAVRAAEQPNVLFLFADDMCFQTIHEFGHENIETPNLDRLARRGTTFTHAYNMGGWNGAICIASRTMLNTGRFLWHAEAVDEQCEQERIAGRFWPEHLKKAGYRTYMTGKWHVKAKAEKAFDVARHVRPGMPKTVDESYNRPLAGQPDLWSPFDRSIGGFWEGGKHWSEVVADDALDYVADAKGRDNPFFMYIAFNAPHDPRQSPEEYIAKYPREQMQIPVNFQPQYPYADGIGCSPSLRDEHLMPSPRTELAVRAHRQEYFAIITHLDAQIGRILDALDSSGKADSTWIVFTADHGLAVGQHGLVGKQNMYDHSVRVPFLIAGPGVEAGRKLNTPIYLQDVMPTTLELAGVDRPEHVEFLSLLPLLRGETTKHYDATYGAYLELQRMVTDDGYKLILYPKLKVWRLYHVADDPHEQRDIASQDGSQAIARRLFQRLLTLQDRIGDQLNLREVYPALSESS